MEETLLEKAWGYVEKVISPYQFWLITLVITGALAFLPNELLDKLSVQAIASSYRGWLVIIFSIAVLVMILKGATYLISTICSFERVDASNLNDEEKALLFFFVKNQFQEVSLHRDHPSVISLRNCKFITHSYSPIYVVTAGNVHFDDLIPTEAARKKLSSHRFQRKILSGLDEDKVLSFVNHISQQEYSRHSTQTLR